MALEDKDPRLPWIVERANTCLKLKSDRFMKMATSEAECVALKEFLDNQDCARVFFVDGAKEMYCYALPPQSTKKKVMFLLKLVPRSLLMVTFFEDAGLICLELVRSIWLEAAAQLPVSVMTSSGS